MLRPSPYSEQTEVLKLRPSIRNKLAAALDRSDSWQSLAEILTKNCSDEFSELLYSAEDIMNFQTKSRWTGSPTLTLLEDWSRRGNPRPKIRDLLKLLLRIEHFRAASIISVDVLNGAPIESPPVSLVTNENVQPRGMPASINTEAPVPSATNLSAISSSLSQLSFSAQSTKVVTDSSKEEFLNNIRSEGSIANSSLDSHGSILDVEQSLSNVLANCHNVLNLSFHTVRELTDNFNSAPYNQGGRLVGEGAFGSVFSGSLANVGQVAVKCLKGDPEIIQQFQNEVKVLSQVRHENILRLVGYSFNNHVSCLVYEFMSGGSLLDRLACKFNFRPLGWIQRLAIALETARGILYLHTSAERPLVHRDIKSANILLDNNLHAKVGDFGLVRQGARGSGAASTMVKTQTVFGTSVYMPREAFRGDISAKMDVFAYGIVLLEILTGLPPQDSNREEEDLLTYMNEKCDNLSDFIDKRLSDVNESKAEKVYDIAVRCTDQFKSRRPTMQECMPDLEGLLS